MPKSSIAKLDGLISFGLYFPMDLREGSDVGLQGEPTGRASVEWPTVAVIGVVAVAWVALLWAPLPWFVRIPLLALLGAWHLSTQHELVHGHPFHHVGTSRALGFAPLNCWLPFEVYRRMHLQHHQSDLTNPLDDPESYHVSPAQWDATPAPKRLLLKINRTLLGRMIIGPALAITAVLRQQARRLWSGDREAWAEWIPHLLAVALVLGIIMKSPTPVWEYVVGFGYGGMSVGKIRSFAEHRAVAEGSRTAVVDAGPFMSLLFLNNNLHFAHHSQPRVPWYRLPTVSRVLGTEESAAGAGVYSSYLEVARRYLVRPFDQPVHPLSVQSDRGIH